MFSASVTICPASGPCSLDVQPRAEVQVSNWYGACGLALRVRTAYSCRAVACRLPLSTVAKAGETKGREKGDSDCGHAAIINFQA